MYSDSKRKERLTATQRFLLTASMCVPGGSYRCVIDIWGIHASPKKSKKARERFVWDWGECSSKNAKMMVQRCLDYGHNKNFRAYCNGKKYLPNLKPRYCKRQYAILEKLKQRYPAQGMLAWDLLRALSVVGGAYMGGAMEYAQAAELALMICKRLQENFSSWDDMMGSYLLGYQFWRGKRAIDRFCYYRLLRRWVCKASWDTPLKESEVVL